MEGENVKALYETMKIGDRRTVVVRLHGAYQLTRGQNQTGETVLFNRAVLAKTTQEYKGYLQGWVQVDIDWDSFILQPSAWRQLLNWLLRRTPIVRIPKAIALAPRNVEAK